MERLGRSLRRWKRGKISREELFREIWRVYHPKLQTYLQNCGAGGEDVSDLTSDVLIRVFEKVDSYDSRFAFSTWIYRVARYYAIDQFRKKRLSYGPLDDEEPPDFTTPESLQIKRTERELVRRAVERLNPAERELIFLHFYEEMKYADIAKITGAPLGTVKYRMALCRGKLKKILERDFYDK